MCGIFGLYEMDNKKPINFERFGLSLKLMNHRGPDDISVKKILPNLVFGHVRLSIIDLSPLSNQPFNDISNSYHLVFNGMIYNYLEIRLELQEFGYHFKTSSDTEVLLYSYIHWGKNCVEKFNGMWSFAIYDTIKNIIFCSRDRFGIKPFNYSFINGSFIFSSEIKSIISYYPELKIPNYNVIANFCRSSVGAQIPETWFTEVKRLMPAHNLIISNNQIYTERYWDYPRKTKHSLDFDKCKEKFKNLLLDSVNIRMRSDVSIGVTLSSGLDSMSIVSLLKNKELKTYTAQFSKGSFSVNESINYSSNKEIDEASVVKEVVNEFNLDATFVEIDYSNYVEKVRKLIYHLESGNGSPAIIPYNQLLNLASHEVKVVLEGQGADELLGGYVSAFFPRYILGLIRNFKFRKVYFELVEFKKTYSLLATFFLYIRTIDFNFLHLIFYKFVGIDALFVGKIRKYERIKDYPYNPRGFDDKFNSELYKSHTGGLVNLLHYGDAVSMSNSIESRLPFLDYRLVEFVFSLPSSFKFNNAKGKYIQREALRGDLHESIYSSSRKLGFDSPLEYLFRSDEFGSPISILLSEKCLNRKLFDKDAIVKAHNKMIKGNRFFARVFFRMLCVELWFREFID
jgi:asparagine synthase (glutamine-hydrolysing)